MAIQDKGSNYQFYQGTPSANVPRSVFDLSYLNTFSANEGQLIPVYTQYTLPNDDYQLSIDALLRVVNPPVVPLMSRQRVFFHTYWCSFSQLWKDAQVFFSKGRTMASYAMASGIRMPSLDFVLSSDSDKKLFKRSSLADYLGFNFASYDFLSRSGEARVSVPLLKFMMYLRVWRDYYSNQRLDSAALTASTKSVDKDVLAFLFPSDDADFRIGSDVWKCLLSDAPHRTALLSLLCSLRYRDFTDDYFTTSQLTPVYTDDLPQVGLFTSADNMSVSTTLSASSYSGGADPQYMLGYGTNGISGLAAKTFVSSTSSGGSPSTRTGFDVGSLSVDGVVQGFGTNSFVSLPNIGSTLARYLKADSRISGHGVVSGLTIDAIRNAEAATLILEKMARTDGTYREYMKVMFGENPYSALDYRPRYIGGTYQPIVYTQVLNTAGGSVPQGTVSGQGISSANGNIGKFHSDDYGLLMTIMSVMPDTYYCQGRQREDTYQVAEDFYLPDRAQLGMQAVLNKELYYTGTVVDEGVFGYQNRYDELRYRQNEVHGAVADSSNLSFFPYVQTRLFESCPTLSPSFVTTEKNVPKDWLTAPEEFPYVVQVANNVRAVRPVPYRAVPASFGM